MRTTLQWIARAGYAARGLVFLVIGALGVAAAIGLRGHAAGASGAFTTIVSQPLGDVLLLLIAIGLLCFAAWRVIQGIFDTDHYGREPRGLARRTGFVLSGVLYAGLAIWAASYLMMSRQARQRGSEVSDWTAWLMGQPFGRWLLGIVGLGVIAAGLASALRGWKAKFKHRLKVSNRWRTWVIVLGRVGFFARATAFAIVGSFVVVASWQAEPAMAAGLSGALQTLSRYPHGWILLGATALGLLTFGVFEIFQAVFHRIDVHRDN